MDFTVTALSPLVGSRVDSDKQTLLDGSKAAELRELLEQRGVLTFPRIDMSDEEQRTFARTLGTPTDQGERGLHKISLDEKVTAMAKYLKGSIAEHYNALVIEEKLMPLMAQATARLAEPS